MGLEPVLLQLEHVATNRSRNHHFIHLGLRLALALQPPSSLARDGWNGGCDFDLQRHALTEEVRVQAQSLYLDSQFINQSNVTFFKISSLYAQSINSWKINFQNILLNCFVIKFLLHTSIPFSRIYVIIHFSALQKINFQDILLNQFLAARYQMIQISNRQRLVMEGLFLELIVLLVTGCNFVIFRNRVSELLQF